VDDLQGTLEQLFDGGRRSAGEIRDVGGGKLIVTLN
jgi:hypothetical protein